GVGRDGGAGLGGLSLRLACRTESRGSPGVEKQRAGKSRLFAYGLMPTAMAVGKAPTALRPSAIRIDDVTGRCSSGRAVNALPDGAAGPTAMAAGKAPTALRPSAIRIGDVTGRCGFA